MQPLKTLGGGAFVHMTFQVENPFVTAGVPALAGLAGDAGVILPGISASLNHLGISVDTAAENDANLLTLIVNPDLVIKVKMSGGSSSDTDFETGTATTSSTTAWDVTGMTDMTGPDLVDGTVWGLAGTNAGLYRSITTTDANTITILNPWPTATAVGDTFHAVAASAPGMIPGVVLTGTFDQNDSTDDAATIDSYFVLEGDYNTSQTSFLHVVSQAHALTSSV